MLQFNICITSISRGVSEKKTIFSNDAPFSIVDAALSTKGMVAASIMIFAVGFANWSIRHISVYKR